MASPRIYEYDPLWVISTPTCARGACLKAQLFKRRRFGRRLRRIEDQKAKPKSQKANTKKEERKKREEKKMGYVLRVRLASFFGGAAVASFLGSISFTMITRLPTRPFLNRRNVESSSGS
ncbi:hypothetical protein Prudu_007828 [Prunus dulcis]|uniref:Transmembrane protein n=1 Tax=Prunus dulcis TaxID=3755 RepID=A0A4Y1R2Y8_PRUDU|nr:hypothetical protein Prudu_007828 [Prunus dulcis]